MHPAWMERGLLAIEESRFEDAKVAFKWIVDREPNNADARYHMARAQFANGELKAADRSIVRALREDPENVQFMELQLEIGFPREPLEIIRKTRRDELAHKILALDSLSVPSNIQLGQSMMKEWLKGRKRMTISGLTPIGAADLGTTRPGRGNMGWLGIDQLSNGRAFAGGVRPDMVFNIDQQRQMGFEAIDMSEYAAKSFPKAVAFLRRALIREPDNQEAYLHLARLYLTRSDWDSLLEMATEMREHRPEDYHGWLLTGYAHHLKVELKEAEDDFEDAIKLMPDSIRVVYEDVDQIMNKKGLKAKKANKDFSLDAFWDFRDPRLLTPENERVSEHYARVTYADLLFAEPKVNMLGRDSERGEIYIRYGAPYNEYFLSNQVADCGPNSYKHFHVFEYPEFKLVFGNLFPHLNQYVLYSPCSQVFGAAGALAAKMDFKIISGETIRELPEAFNYDASGTRTEFPYLASSFKGQGGKVDVYVPYGIPVETNALQLRHTLDLHAGAFLLNQEEGLLAENHRRLEDIRVKDLTHFELGTLWLDTHQLEASPGLYDLSVEFETGTGAGRGFYRASIDLPDFGTDKLQVSDVLLAYLVEEAEDTEAIPSGMLMRDGLFIKPAPWGVFKKSQPMYLYFEMYNLAKGSNDQARYEVEAALVEYRGEKGLSRLIKRVFRGRADEGVAVKFANVTQSDEEGQYLIMDASDQEPGAYVLVMRVTDQIRKQTVETQRIVLLE